MTQQQALDILKLGYNVYLTGPAGSGKTYLLNQYIRYLKENKVAVGITASTGIAATHMGGTTIHSWTGMGIREGMSELEIMELRKRPYLRNRFKQTKVLIIDEISMLHATRLDMVDAICRTFKGNSLPFGGLQIVMCGDFFQLPPVVRNSAGQNLGGRGKSGENGFDSGQARMTIDSPSPSNNDLSPFVTKSETWKRMQLKICYLDEQHRQEDRAFLRVLNDIRNNEVSEMTVEYLSDRLNKEVKGYAKATRLFTHNADVDAINKLQLESLPGELHEYYMTSRGSIGLTEILRRSCLAPEVLQLKVGAQVMFVKNNWDAGYVNGTLGEVIGFTKEEAPIVRTFDGAEITVGQASWEVKEPSITGQGAEQVVAAIAQMPLRLAWAITVHKSQGMSLDAAEVDLSRSFVPGMGYVALSRVRSLSGLKLMGLNQMALQVHPEVAEMDKHFIEQSYEAMSLLNALEKEKKEQMQQDFLGYLQEK